LPRMLGYFSTVSTERHRLNVASQSLTLRERMETEAILSTKKKLDALERSKVLKAENVFEYLGVTTQLLYFL
jgi:hypothetical protein